MTKTDDAAMQSPMNRSQFLAAFPQLCSVLLDEWPQLDAEAVAATNGELEKVILLVVEKTGHTKTLARRQLEELYRIVTAPADSRPPRRSAVAHEARAAAATFTDSAHEALHGLEALIKQFDKKTAPLLRELRGGALAHTGDKLRDHWFVSLLASVGFGFILSVVFNGLTRSK